MGGGCRGGLTAAPLLKAHLGKNPLLCAEIHSFCHTAFFLTRNGNVRCHFVVPTVVQERGPGPVGTALGHTIFSVWSHGHVSGIS